MKKEFISYIESLPKSKNSGNKYAGAIKTISERFINQDIFKITSEKDFTIILSQLKNDIEFNNLNTRGHRMYSRAIKCYKEFCHFIIKIILKKNTCFPICKNI